MSCLFLLPLLGVAANVLIKQSPFVKARSTGYVSSRQCLEVKESISEDILFFY